MDELRRASELALSVDDVIRIAIKLAVDAGDFERASAITLPERIFLDQWKRTDFSRTKPSAASGRTSRSWSGSGSGSERAETAKALNDWRGVGPLHKR